MLRSISLGHRFPRPQKSCAYKCETFSSPRSFNGPIRESGFMHTILLSYSLLYIYMIIKHIYIFIIPHNKCEYLFLKVSVWLPLYIQTKIKGLSMSFLPVFHIKDKGTYYVSVCLCLYFQTKDKRSQYVFVCTFRQKIKGLSISLSVLSDKR